jgi:phosphate transport system protein
MSDHIVKQYEVELRQLREIAIAMGVLATNQLEGAIAAAERPNADAAARVVEREPEADRLEHQIENLAVRLIALRQPVAVDLRAILSALRISNELERICDYAENMSKRLLALGESGVEAMHSVVRLGRFATTMVNDAMRAYAGKDAAQAQEVWDRDAELDAMYNSLFRELVSYMIEDPRRISASTHMLFIARDLERVGDRATNIAEAVLYLVRGVPVEEERPTADVTKSMMVTASP